MANDRLHLRCTKCNAYVTISKWTPSSGAGNWFDDAYVGSTVNRFLEEHTHPLQPCARDGASLGQDSGFVIDTDETLAIARSDTESLARQQEKAAVTSAVASTLDDLGK